MLAVWNWCVLFVFCSHIRFRLFGVGLVSIQVLGVVCALFYIFCFKSATMVCFLFCFELRWIAFRALKKFG